jgi:outer membrane protein
VIAFPTLVASLAIAIQSPLTLDAAVAQAESNAYAVLIQKATIEGQRQRLAQAKAALNPRLALNTVYTRYDEQIDASFGPGQSFVIQPVQTTVLTLAFQYNFDLAGGAKKQVSAQSRSLLLQELGLNVLLNDIRLSVRSAYLNVLRAKAQVRVAEQALELSKARRDRAQKQFEQSLVARVDVMRFETQVTSTQASFIQATNAQKNAEQNLNLTLARPVDTPVIVADTQDFELTGIDAGAIVATAQKTRPDILRAQESVGVFRDLVSVEEAGDDPSLTLGVNHIRNLNAAGLNPRPNQTVGQVTLSIPIFDQGITRKRVQAARQDEVTAKTQVEQLKLSVDQEVRAAINNWQTAKARLKSGEDQVRLAEEVYRISVIRRDAGEATYVEVVDAINEVTQARNNVVNARYDAHLALFQLQRAVGTDAVLQPVPSTNSQSDAQRAGGQK